MTKWLAGLVDLLRASWLWSTAVDGGLICDVKCPISIWTADCTIGVRRLDPSLEYYGM